MSKFTKYFLASLSALMMADPALAQGPGGVSATDAGATGVGASPAVPTSIVRPGLLEKSFLGTSNLANPINAKKEITDQAILSISNELIVEMVGQEKFNKNKALIQRIVAQSSKYIPFSKTGELIKSGDDFKLNVTLNVSLEDLRILLKNSGVLRESDLSPVLLPMVSFRDEINDSTYMWWIDQEVTNNGPAIMKALEQSLKKTFRKSDFFVLQPVQYNLAKSLTDDLKIKEFSPESYKKLANVMQTPLLVLGEVSVNKSAKGKGYVLKFQGSVIQAAQQRVIADMTRQFETEAGDLNRVVENKMREVSESLAQDFSNQVTEAWQRGSIGANQIKLVISGRMNLPVMEGVRDALKAKAREIKTIRERLLSAQENIFEVESSIAPKELGVKLDGTEFGNVKLVLESSTDSLIQLKVIKK